MGRVLLLFKRAAVRCGCVIVPIAKSALVAYISFSLLGAVLELVGHAGPSPAAFPAPSKLYGDVIRATHASSEAAKLWFNVLTTITVPIADLAFLSAAELWIKASPSVWLIFDDGWTAIRDAGPYRQASGCVMILLTVALWAAQREIKRQRYVERISGWGHQVTGRVTRRYSAVVSSVRRRSRLAADVLPHICFWGAWATICYAIPPIVETLATGSTAWVVMYGWPAIASWSAVQSSPALPPHVVETALESSEKRLHNSEKKKGEVGVGNDTDKATNSVLGGLVSTVRRRFVSKSVEKPVSNERAERLRIRKDNASVKRWFEEMKPILRWLEYWSVFGMLWLAEELPLTGHLLEALPYPFWPYLRFGLALWLQIPFTEGSRTGFALLVFILDRHVRAVPSPINSEQRSIVLNTLVTLRIISSASRNTIIDVVETGGSLLLLSFCFLFTPGFVTEWGCAIVGLGYAGWKTLLCVRSCRAGADSASASKGALTVDMRKKEHSFSVGVISSSTVHYLKYWSLVPVLFPLHDWLSSGILGWLPLWTHLRLLGVVWMLLPYCHGASTLFDQFTDAYFSLRMPTLINASTSSENDTLAAFVRKGKKSVGQEFKRKSNGTERSETECTQQNVESEPLSVCSGKHSEEMSEDHREEKNERRVAELDTEEQLSADYDSSQSVDVGDDYEHVELRASREQNEHSLNSINQTNAASSNPNSVFLPESISLLRANGYDSS